MAVGPEKPLRLHAVVGATTQPRGLLSYMCILIFHRPTLHHPFIHPKLVRSLILQLSTVHVLCMIPFATPVLSNYPNRHIEHRHPQVGEPQLKFDLKVLPPHQDWEDVKDAEPVEVWRSPPHLSQDAVPSSELHQSNNPSKRPRPLSLDTNIASYSPAEPSIEPQQEEKVCVICMDEPREVVFNCRHCACCHDCANEITRCPLCRTVIAVRQTAPSEARRAVGFASCMPQSVQTTKAEEDNFNSPASDNWLSQHVSRYMRPATSPSTTPHEPDVVHIIIVLDRSRSMRRRRQQMLDSVNHFIRQQKQLQQEQPNLQQAKLTMLQFDSRSSFIFVAQPLMECRELTLADYAVHGGTALYDSLMLLIRKFRHCENAIVAVITDGVDTCSRTANQSQAAGSIVEIRRIMGWHFHYLCVDVEGAHQGEALGFDTTTEVRPERLAAGVSRRLSSEVASSRASMSGRRSHIPSQ